MARVLGFGAVGFFGGVWARSFFDFGWVGIIFLLMIVVILATVTWVFRDESTHRVLQIFVVILVGITIGTIRFQVADRSLGDPTLLTHIGQEVFIEGVVIREPKHKAKSQQVLVKVDTLDNEKISPSQVLVFAERFPEFEYGDRIRFSGMISEPEAFETDTGRIFDYASYLSKDKIGYTMSFPVGERISSGGGNPINRWLFAGKKKFVDALMRTISEPAASLISGVTIGVDEGLPASLEQALRTTGIIHIVVLSGYNVTLVSVAILWIFRALPLFISGIGAGLGILAFALITGLSATVVRASIMAVLALVAFHTRRRYDITRALFAAAFFMVLINPKILAFDISFQLSFLATLGLITFSAPIAARMHRLPTFIRSILAATLATQITVLPLLLYQTGALSLISPLTNVVVLPLVPIAMFAGFGAGFLGLFADWLALPVALIAGGLGDTILGISSFLSRIPFASVTVPETSGLIILALYVIGGVWVYKKKTRSKDTLS